MNHIKTNRTFHDWFGKFGVMACCLVLFTVFSLVSPYFFQPSNVNLLLLNQLAVGFFAVGSLLPLIVGEFDISLGYLIGLCIMMGAWFAQYVKDPVLIILFTMFISITMGVLKGFIVVYLKVPATISTLGIGTFYYGLTFAASNGSSITGQIPQEIMNFSKGSTLFINNGVWLFLILAVALYYVLEHTPLGKQMYAVGLSEEVSRLAGVRTKFLRFISFVIGSAFIGVCAVLLLGQSGNAYPDTGPSYLLPGMAAVFFSITTHKQGSFNVPGLLAGWLLMAIAFNGISLLGAPFWMEALINAIILIVVVLTTRIKSGASFS